jgi:hypothetical protein
MAAAAWLFATGCGAGPEAASNRIGVGDSRYRADLSRVPTAAGSGEARLRLEPEAGWHIVPEAPASLRLVAPEGFEFASPQQRGSDALEHSEQALEFALSLRSTRARGRVRPPDAPARAQIKFGICRDDAEGCEIVRQELELPLQRILAASVP